MKMGVELPTAFINCRLGAGVKEDFPAYTDL